MPTFHMKKKKTIPILLIGLSLVLLGLSSCSSNSSGTGGPLAKRGTLDLRNWDPTAQGPVALDGEWEFHWERLLGPEDFLRGNSTGIDDVIIVPDVWSGHKVGDTKISSSGYATYRLHVLIKPTQEPLAFKFLSLGTAYAFYVNGKITASAGQVGKSAASSMPDWRPQVAAFLAEDDHLDLILQISNFHHRKGGATERIWLGSERDIRQMRERNLAFQLFLCGSIFIMGLYHLALFLMRRHDTASLHFGLFCLLIALYTLLAGERYFLDLFPSADWEFRVRLTNVSSFLSVPVFLAFIHSLFNQEMNKRVLRLLQGAILALTTAVLFMPANLYSNIIPVYHILSLIAGIYILRILVLAIRRKREGAGILFAGIIILIAALINDILYDNALLKTGQFIYLGFFLFIFTQSFFLSLRFSNAFATISSQSRVLIETNKAMEQEVNERRLAEKALLESESKYRLLMEEAPIALCNLDVQGIIQFVNRRFEEYTGYQREEVLGRSGLTLDIFSQEAQQKMVQRLSERLAGASSVPTELDLILKDGCSKWVEMEARIIEEHGIPAGFQVAASDISARKQAQSELQKAHDLLEKRVMERTARLDDINKELMREIGVRKQAEIRWQQAKEAAEVANKAKSEFLANMSHELRTPLNHMIGFTELVTDRAVGPLNATQEEYLNDVLGSSRHLLSLINDILDLSKIEAGKMVLEVSEIAFQSLLENSLVMIKEKAMNHGLKIGTRFMDIPPIIRADERKLKQILYNLLSNAVKFTPDKGSVLLEARSMDGHGVQITVSDTGVGLPESDLERIFQPFEQGDNSTSRKYQGTGLGLSLTRKMVELHGGRIWAESNGLGCGSTFIITLPF
jgi:PAS domain S-box-containing protein